MMSLGLGWARWPWFMAHSEACIRILSGLSACVCVRLDPYKSYAAKEKLVEALIKDVGLAGKESQYVGGPLPGGLNIRGLSGGEKRRLSLVREVSPAASH
jgi:hypothetical protein